MPSLQHRFRAPLLGNPVVEPTVQGCPGGCRPLCDSCADYEAEEGGVGSGHRLPNAGTENRSDGTPYRRGRVRASVPSH